MKEQLELHREFRDKQEKYAYYVIALCIAAIGFSVTQTIGQPLKNIQIPLGLAIICWGISINCGLRFIGIIVSSIHRNSMYFDLIQGKDSIAGKHPEKIEIGLEVYHKGSDELSKKSSSLYNWQERLFYIGIILFITWRLLEMFFTKK